MSALQGNRETRHLFAGVKILAQQGELPIEVLDIVSDSRKVVSGSLFVAVRGVNSDGHVYIPRAIQAGATLIVYESPLAEFTAGICYLQVEDSAETLGILASNYYGNPSSQFKVVGVTGTNGKTSVATFLYHLMEQMGLRAGLISTVENRVHNKIYSTNYTTPTPLELQALFAEMLAAGCEYAFMEVSSHALVQRRVAGVHFAGGIFTNLTRDHLDYHETFSAYRDAKKLFFDMLPRDSFALSNGDDANGEYMLQNCVARKEYYSLTKLAFVKCDLVSQELEGMAVRLNGTEVQLQLLGKFNAYNISAVYGAALLLGFDGMELLRQISLLRPVRGRVEYLPIAGRVGVVDFAHTPDALEKVLETLQAILPPGASIIGVIGAGGDRDAGKRPQMAATAVRYCRQLILTSDNPRHESPEAIIAQMYEGILPEDRDRVLRNVDRREAIRMAVALSCKGDFLLIAGKGHEAYQQIGDEKFPFDDIAELRKALEAINN